MLCGLDNSDQQNFRQSSYQFLEQMLDLTHQYQKIYTLDHSPFVAELLPSKAPEIYANNP